MMKQALLLIRRAAGGRSQGLHICGEVATLDKCLLQLKSLPPSMPSLRHPNELSATTYPHVGVPGSVSSNG